MSHYTMIYKNGKGMRDFFGPFCFYCSLVFYILEVFLIKQLFHSHLLDIRASLAIYIISYPTRAHGIIVKYFSSHIGTCICLDTKHAIFVIPL